MAPTLTAPGKYAMVAAVMALSVKLSLNGLRRKEFKLHEQGHDMCLMTVGVSIPGAAAAAVKQSHEMSIWIWFAIAAFVSMIVSALIAEAAEESSTPDKRLGIAKALWTLANLVLGAGSFLFYMLLTVVKAQ
jgi:hypothetical protein